MLIINSIGERKLKPSLEIKKGSIGIALNQTCIYPQDSPGGWHIIGVSPCRILQFKIKISMFWLIQVIKLKF
ncbi:MAG: carboxyltransferase domain-containing protein [Candidatus Marisimplicoccus sp.]